MGQTRLMTGTSGEEAAGLYGAGFAVGSLPGVRARSRLEGLRIKVCPDERIEVRAECT